MVRLMLFLMRPMISLQPPRSAGLLTLNIRQGIKTYFLAIIFLLPNFVNAEESCMEHVVSDSDINECVQQEYDRAEAVLNATYKEVLSALSKDGADGIEVKQELVKAQRHWILFRKSDCDAVYSYNKGGSVGFPEAFMCMKRHAEQRTEDLHRFY